MLPQIQILELHGVVVESDGAFAKERANEKCCLYIRNCQTRRDYRPHVLRRIKLRSSLCSYHLSFILALMICRKDLAYEPATFHLAQETGSDC